MTSEEQVQKINELTAQVKDLGNKLIASNNALQELNRKFESHQHSGRDFSLALDKEINLKPGVPIKLGNGGIITYSTADLNSIAPGTANEQTALVLAAGKDMGSGVGYSTKNMQMVFQHYPQSATNQSFLTMARPPLLSSLPGSTISTTAAGNTVTINGYNFTTNELAGALIVITDSAGAFVETQTIASNTATVITISGTWLATTSGGTFFIYVPVFFGSAQTIFQRFYTQEGTAGGIRFGVGTTNGGQNGLLYMDATGDLYWRDKAGTSVKLN